MSSEFNEHEEQVIRTLKSTPPVPRQEFYRQMSDMPWKKDKAMTLQKRTLFVAAVCAVMTLAIWFVPPFRTLAQEIIDSLFTRTLSDHRVIEYNAAVETEISQLTVESFDSTEALERRYDIDILAPSSLPRPYAFDRVTYDLLSHTIWLNYNSPPGRGLQVTVFLPGSDMESWSIVGSTAPIVQVEIITSRGIFTGEYVEGAWFIGADDIVPTPQTGGLVTQSAEWGNDVSMRRLRWEDNGSVYEISAMGGSGNIPERDLMLEELIALAESFE